MDEDESIIYKELREHLDSFPIGYPNTKSGVEIDILKQLFTPKEALIAKNLRFSWSKDLEPLDIIFNRFNDMGMPIEELEKNLDTMTKKGTIHFKKEGGKKYYSNAQYLIGIYEFQVNRLNLEFIKNNISYLKEALGMELFGTKISQFRTIPVEQSITHEHYAPTYDQLKKVIDNAEEPIGVVNCICRQAMDLLERPCKLTNRREVCLGFGPMAKLYIDNGWVGRIISKDEALEILKKNEEEGLVLQAGNSLNPHFICSCCGCCCPVLLGAKNFPRPVQFFSANFTAEVDIELCSGCGTCVDRCQMNAIKIVREVSKINRKKCIGCGNCVSTCPEEAITLKKKEKEIEPYPSMDDLYNGILEKKLELRGKN